MKVTKPKQRSTRSGVEKIPPNPEVESILDFSILDHPSIKEFPTIKPHHAAIIIFLKGLASGLRHRHALEAAGMTWMQFYQIYRRCRPLWDFYLECEEAQKQYWILVRQDEADRRAVEGVEKPVFWRGKTVGHIREYSDSLLALQLKANNPDKYDRQSLSNIQGEGVVLNLNMNIVRDPKEITERKTDGLEPYTEAESEDTAGLPDTFTDGNQAAGARRIGDPEGNPIAGGSEDPMCTGENGGGNREASERFSSKVQTGNPLQGACLFSRPPEFEPAPAPVLSDAEKRKKRQVARSKRRAKAKAKALPAVSGTAGDLGNKSE